jgi:hypothetical protein
MTMDRIRAWGMSSGVMKPGKDACRERSSIHLKLYCERVCMAIVLVLGSLSARPLTHTHLNTLLTEISVSMLGVPFSD